MTFDGHLALRASPRERGRTVLAEQSFRAPFHLSKPYWDEDVRVLLAQVVNPTAGILSGDRLVSEIAVDPGASLLVTTPSASRLFQMRGGQAECCQRFVVASDGWLEFAPEPLVPHRGSRYRQITRAEVAPGGSFFFVDQLMPGRIGHGEVCQWERLTLDLEVRMGETLVLRERLDQSGEEFRGLAESMGFGAAACLATCLLIAPTAADLAADWAHRLAALHRDGTWVGLSALAQGGCSLKVVASDNIRLRQTLREARAILAGSFPRLGSAERKF
jgi:urease accessory protein